jgi:hypothetical protein
MRFAPVFNSDRRDVRPAQFSRNCFWKRRSPLHDSTATAVVDGPAPQHYEHFVC